jgi:alpha-glucosidase
VQAAMHEVLRFWLARGVDGFRVDVLWRLIKDDQFRNNPPNPYFKPGVAPPDEVLQVYSGDRPEVHDRLLIGELYLPIQKLVNYYGHKLGGAHIPLNFQLIFTRWDARAIETLIEQYEAAIPEGGWPNWVLGNHDQPRIASRVGLAQARVAAMLLLTVRGTPTLYYGDEIGMQNVAIPPERVQDPFERRVPGLGFGRDPERTPMQWSTAPNAGFTTGIPWLPIDADASVVNVEVERKEPDSMLALYHALIALRRANPALALGTYQPIAANGSVLAYIRAREGARFLVALNLSDEPAALAFGGSGLTGKIRLSTHLDRSDEPLASDLPLRGDEGVVVQLDP